jgi:hypothetical protein
VTAGTARPGRTGVHACVRNLVGVVSAPALGLTTAMRAVNASCVLLDGTLAERRPDR